MHFTHTKYWGISDKNSKFTEVFILMCLLLTCPYKTSKFLTLKLTAVLIKAYHLYWHYRKCLIVSLTLFRMRVTGAKKASSTSFSPVTSTNVRFSPQNFLNFSFNSFDRLVWNIKFLPSASPKLLKLIQDHPWKKAAFLVKSL